MRPKHSSAEAQLGLPEYRGHSLAEKVAFAMLVMFVSGALLGLFGDGPLSDSTVSSADGQVRVEYQRFCRREAPQSLDVIFPTPPGADTIEVAIGSDYLRRVQITDILPQPVESSHRQTGNFRFSTDGSGQTMTVRLYLKPRDAGVIEAHLAVGSPGQQRQLRFKQLVYP